MKYFSGKALPSEAYLKEVGASELRTLQVRLREAQKELNALKRAFDPGRLEGYINLLIGIWTE